MSQRYVVQPVSKFRAKVSEGVIRETKTTRLIFRPEIVDNQHEPGATVHGTLVHQRRASAGRPWKDDDSFKLATLKSGESVQLQLDATATRRLYLDLERLFQLPVEWVYGENRRFKVVDVDQPYVPHGRLTRVIEEHAAGNEDELAGALEHI